MITRLKVLAALTRIKDGHRLPSHTSDTITTPGMCAQFVRQTSEDVLGLKPGNWQVATMALKFMRERGGTVRYATDYEKAAVELGLDYPKGTRPNVGDIGYWPYTARDGNPYGHTALFYGYINGVGYWLENTDAKNRIGGTKIFKNGCVWLTPESVLGTPRVLAKPSADAYPVEAISKKETLKDADLDGLELHLIDPSGNTKLYKIKKASRNDKKIYIKTE